MVCVQANGSKLSLCQSRCKPQTLVIWGCSLVRMHCKDWVRASTHNHVPVISRAKCAQAGEGRIIVKYILLEAEGHRKHGFWTSRRGP
eukprot:scaffold61252_cov20-Tisochrysis_lutea.AAC.1